MSYQGYQLGDGEAAGDPVTDPLIVRLDEILERQKAEESRRKWTLLFTVGGALFAFVRLGIIALPHIRRHAAGSLGAAPSLNPARRRRRRRYRR